MRSGRCGLALPRPTASRDAPCAHGELVEASPPPWVGLVSNESSVAKRKPTLDCLLYRLGEIANLRIPVSGEVLGVGQEVARKLVALLVGWVWIVGAHRLGSFACSCFRLAETSSQPRQDAQPHPRRALSSPLAYPFSAGLLHCSRFWLIIKRSPVSRELSATG